MIRRQPNTEYVLSLSYGKDSIACLEAIKLLGYPLDRVVHAEVWATDTIPADLPPMVEFKRKADQMILDRYGIRVEHYCAMRAVERERERERELHTRTLSTAQCTPRNTGVSKSTVSQRPKEPGVIHDSKWLHSPVLSKETFETMFYHVPKRRDGSTKIYGFPISATRGNWCTSLKTRVFG